MGHWDFNDGPFCEDFDDANSADDVSSSLALWHRAAQKRAKAAADKQEMRTGDS